MGFTDAREPSKNAIFHGDGFLLHHVVLISVKVTYPPICKEMITDLRKTETRTESVGHNYVKPQPEINFLF